MKKQSLILTSAALLFLGACSSATPASSEKPEETAVSEVTEETKEPETTPEATPTPEAEEEIVYAPGTVNGSVYESKTAGLGIDLSGWEFADAATLGEHNQMDGEATEEALLNRMDTEHLVMDMIATNYGGNVNQNINIQFQDVSLTPTMSSYTEKEIADNTAPRMKDGLISAGYENVTLDSADFNMAGKDCGAILINGTYKGYELFQKEVLMWRGKYLMFITVTCANEAEADEILAKFYVLGN